MLTQFLHTANLENLLRSRTWMSEVAIENTLRNYSYHNNGGTPFIIKNTRPGNFHYQVWPVPGGWHVRPWKLGLSTQELAEMADISLK